MAPEPLYLNGTFTSLSKGRVHVEDRGFQLGDGVYEVVKVLNGRPLWLQDHLDRLDRSLSGIGLAVRATDHGLAEVVPELARRSEVREGIVYVQITRGVGPREFEFPATALPTVLAYVRAVPGPTVDAIQAGEALHPVADLRWARCDIKAIDLLATVLAKEEARRAGAQEALFVAPDGVVREGGSSSAFAVIGGVLRTHPLDNHILDGITRRRALELARENGYSAEERAFALTEITSGAEAGCEVFVASTVKGIMPVTRVGEHRIGGGRPGPFTLGLLELFRRRAAFLVGAEPPAELLGGAGPPRASS